jgi:PAS domain S-box-containing protein
LYRHQVEKRHRERERWFSTTLHSISDAVITLDLAGNVTFMNVAAEVLTGLTAAEALGKTAYDVLRVVEDELAQQKPHDRSSHPSHTRTTQQFIDDSTAPIVDGDETLGAVLVFRDVAERKRVQLRRELADRLASLGAMAAGVAHEVNNPLTVVVANSSYISDELVLQRAALEAAALPEAVRRLDDISQALFDLRSAARRIGRIVSDLRAVAAPIPGDEGVEVERCIEWALRSTKHEFPEHAQPVTHYHDVPAVSADEVKLGQVFINLLVNAAHATASGNPNRNEVTITTSLDDDGWVAVAISDTGIGIAKENLGRIFEPFFTTKPVGVGTGLGLSICQGIVKSFGGELRVESEEGRGSTFVVLLPPATATRADSRVPTGTRLIRGKILVVDDEDMVLRALTRILNDHDVVCTDSALDALGFVERGDAFDLILSDVLMPKMSGIEFYEALLVQNPALARRVVFFSAGTAKVDDFLRSVPNTRIEKPFDVDGLRETVQRLLRGQAELVAGAA